MYLGVTFLLSKWNAPKWDASKWQLQYGRQKILFIKFKYTWEFVKHKFKTAPTIASIQIFINVKQGVKQRV